MPKDIVIVPASGKIELSGSSTHINELNVHSESIQLTGSLQITGSGPHQFLGYNNTGTPKITIQDPGSSTDYVMHISGGNSQKNVVRIDSTYSSTGHSEGSALYVKGTAAYGAPGSATKAYGGFFLAGETNGLAPDTIALMAQADTDGPPNSYAAVFSGSAGGVVGINTMEPTKELQVKGDISASGIVYAEHLLTTDDLQVGDDIFMTDGGRIGDMGGAGNDDFIIFDNTNRRIETHIDNSVILSVGNGLVGINTDSPTKALQVYGDISASGDLYLYGDDIYNDGTKRLTFGSINTFIGTVSSSNKFSVRDASTNEFARIGTQAAGGDEYISALNPGNFDVKIGDPQGASNEIIFFVNNTNQQMEATASLFSVSNDLRVDGDSIQFGPETDKKVAIHNTNTNGQMAFVNEGLGANLGFWLSGSKAYLGHDNLFHTDNYATANNRGLTVWGQISASEGLCIDDGQVIKSKLFQAGRLGADIFMSASNNNVMIGDVGNASNGFQFSVNDSTQTAFLYCPDDPNGFDEKFGVGTNNPTANINVMGNIWASGSHGHITASGNISSSGTIRANSIVGTLTGTATGLAGTPDIVVGSLTATSITSSIVTSSILHTEGSNQFGDTTSDTHTFVGAITASDNILISKDNDSRDVSLTIRNSQAGSSTNETVSLIFGHGTTGGGKIVSGRDGAYNVGNSASSNLQFYTQTGGVPVSTNERMRLTNLGNLGIGTTTPSKKLEVAGDISASGDIHLHDQKGIHFGEEVAGHNDVHLVTTGTNGTLLVSGSGAGIYLDSKNTRVGIGNSSPNKSLTVGGDISASGAIYVDTTEIVDSSGNINSRFQLSFDYNGRLSAGDKWYTKNARGSFAQLNSQLSAGSNPSGSAVTYLSAGRYSSYTAPRACKLIRSQVVMLNYTNDDDVVLGIYKGTAVNDSNSNITISQIGTDIGGSMDEDKTYMYQTDFSSGNTLAAGDFILFTIHTQTYTSTSYPYISINLEFQYT